MSGEMDKQGVHPGLLDRLLEDFLEAGWLCLEWRIDRTKRELFAVHVLDVAGLEDFARPGLRKGRATALAEARLTTSKLDHPVAKAVLDILSEEEAEQIDPILARALAAVAAHAFAGDVLAERVFSARYLGDSKALSSLRRRLEKLLGPLGRFGIREGAAVTLVGGNGTIRCQESMIGLSDFQPFVGLPREALLSTVTVSFPPDGLFVVENLTAFEACCRGEVAGTGEVLFAWSGGYPGRGVKALVDVATTSGVQIRVWADIDLDGVRIARLVCGWGGTNCEPWRMNPEDLSNAPVSKALTAQFKIAIRKDLRDHRNALLAETLEELLERGDWVEQEMFLGSAHYHRGTPKK